ncbi:hypothetical protein FSARC_6268 [Fusarium sarcochroum]|uniref:Heterokaryon incompatibility domain-containing protein n=1 Tax=Fusarium sarcochroum TaxID=1208366 RepID=A0A8H4TXR6_9HYPO|nr:hypothetical protein FSARC_6268 [Fusarium sarcochroum]
MENRLSVLKKHTPASVANFARRWLKAYDGWVDSWGEKSLSYNKTCMPTRLLDLGNRDSKTWHLVEPQHIIPYAALPHRWSKDTPELVSKELQNYYNPQSDAILPQSYQEIISICRAIPIRYLWIDSLCILQDDGGYEFRREAPLMTAIYGNAFVLAPSQDPHPSPTYSASLMKTPQIRYLPQEITFWCELTYEKDRFVAISGLARAISERTGDKYVAGIWLEYWVYDLLWHPMESRDLGSGRKKFDGEEASAPGSRLIVPSWSWVDFQGSVSLIIPGFKQFTNHRLKMSTTLLNSFESDFYRPLAFVSNTVITPPGSDPFSSFDRVVLKIKCLLLPVSISHTSLSAMQDSSSWQHVFGFWLPSGFELRSIGLESLQLDENDDPSRYPPVFVRLHKPLSPSLHSHLVPLCFITESELHIPVGTAFHQAFAHAIVVQKILGGSDREFRRVGMWYEGLSNTYQLSPIITNTIIKIGVGKTDLPTSGPCIDLAFDESRKQDLGF